MKSRARIQEIFGVGRVLLPVIHPLGRTEALAAVEVAVAAGVRGVFLINQGMDAEAILGLVMKVRARHPRLWVGVNLLGYEPDEVLRMGLDACEGRLDGIWADDAGIDEFAEDQPRALAFVEARRALGWTGLYFGGVAFKYRRAVADDRLAAAARAAAPYMDVICTSGPGTGMAADTTKLPRMRAGLAALDDDTALALASGVTVDNVGDYLEHAEAFLVGTGIEREFGVLDPDRVARLSRLISGS